MAEFDDEDEDFDPEKFWEDFEEPTEDEIREIKEERNRVQNMPLMKKAEQILELTRAITDVIDDSHDLEHVRDIMLEDATTLMPKIAGAEGGDLYSIRMQNAVFIAHHARNLLATTSLLKFENMVEQEYLKLLRDEIGNFRLLFVEWTASFDRSNDIEDGWMKW